MEGERSDNIFRNLSSAHLLLDNLEREDHSLSTKVLIRGYSSGNYQSPQPIPRVPGQPLNGPPHLKDEMGNSSFLESSRSFSLRSLPLPHSTYASLEGRDETRK